MSAAGRWPERRWMHAVRLSKGSGSGTSTRKPSRSGAGGGRDAALLGGGSPAVLGGDFNVAEPDLPRVRPGGRARRRSGLRGGSDPGGVAGARARFAVRPRSGSSERGLKAHAMRVKSITLMRELGPAGRSGAPWLRRTVPPPGGRALRPPGPPSPPSPPRMAARGRTRSRVGSPSRRPRRRSGTRA